MHADGKYSVCQMKDYRIRCRHNLIWLTTENEVFWYATETCFVAFLHSSSWTWIVHDSWEFELNSSCRFMSQHDCNITLINRTSLPFRGIPDRDMLSSLTVRWYWICYQHTRWYGHLSWSTDWTSENCSSKIVHTKEWSSELFAAGTVTSDVHLCQHVVDILVHHDVCRKKRCSLRDKEVVAMVLSIISKLAVSDVDLSSIWTCWNS